MTIRRKLTLMLVLLLLSGLLLLFALGFIAQLAGRATGHDAKASQILRETFEFSTVSQDYLLDQSDRSLYQMQQKQHKLAVLLKSSETMLAEYPEKRQQLLHHAERIEYLLQRLAKNHQQNQLAQSSSFYRKDRLLNRHVEELSRLLSSSVLEITAQAQQLEELYEAEQHWRFMQVQQVVVVAFLLLLTLCGLFMLMIRNSVMVGVQQLQQAAVKITDGMLETQVSETGNDELTEVSRAFNRMSAALQKSHDDLAIRNRMLEQEADLRRAAEGSLKEANSLLELRIAQRTEQLSEALELFDLFMFHSPIYVFIKEVSATESRVLQASENFVDMVGISGSQMRGKGMHELFPESFADKLIADDQLVVEKGVVLSQEEELHDRYYITYKFPIQRGEKRLLAGYTIDITERKQSEHTMREMQAKLLHQDKLASIGQLSAGIAHEINNPMGFINSNFGTLEKYVEKFECYIAMLEEQAKTDQQRQDAAKARKELKLDYVLRDIHQLLEESKEGAERVMKIVQDLKTFARSDSEQIGTADLNQCLDSTLAIIWNQIKYVAEVVKEYGPLPKVVCNIQQINQVFLNLLVNAAHALEDKPGNEPGRITITTWADMAAVYVAVSDNGCGIPEGIAGRIFDPFFTTKEVGKGTGLGLSISHEIIKKHGGELTMESVVGQGTTFTVRLPLIPRIEQTTVKTDG